MKKRIAVLRGINIGGKGKVFMANRIETSRIDKIIIN